MYAGLTAITFALNGSRVLLIDADLRSPRSTFVSGWARVLVSPLCFLERLRFKRQLSHRRNCRISISCLPAQSRRYRLTCSVRSRWKAYWRRYEGTTFIFIDTPPVLAVTDAAILGKISDASILIIRYGAAQKNVVRRCIDLLDRSGTHLLGVAVNVVDFTAPEYSEYYGRKYYKYYGERSPD